MSKQKSNIYDFDGFRLDITEKVLWKGGEVVPLTPKAFDTLVILVEKSGHLVEKEELISQLWPDSFVEENSLSQNVYLIRKALREESQGIRYIETVPRRGYRFIATVKEIPGEDNQEDGKQIGHAGLTKPLPILWSPQRPPRFSRAILFALMLALTLLATGLIWSALRRYDPGINAKRITAVSLNPSGTDIPGAYQAYARGIFFWNKRTEDGLSRSIEYFHQAIAQDSQYALAWAGLADAYAVTGYLGYKYMPSDEAFLKAQEAAMKALSIDQTIAEAYAALSVVRAYYESDLAGAEKEIKKAIALNENNATVHQRYSIYLRDQGRLREALREIQRAHELDPLSLPIGSNLSYIHYLLRDYDQAAICAQKVLEAEPDYFQSLIALGTTWQQKRRYEDAIALLEKVRDQQKGKAGVYYNALEALGHAYAVAGHRAAAEQIIAELNACPEDKDDTTYRQALIRAGLGELDRAFALLEANSRSWTLPPVGLTLDPRFDNLRADLRYEALMRKKFGRIL
ncbi:MAG: winged helix-turn-helix domain-containing protein [Acidobacteria bacterium]|nr:winged helix-turn-helix domain-containing protein [Acidobacteriota bacterium]